MGPLMIGITTLTESDIINIFDNIKQDTEIHKYSVECNIYTKEVVINNYYDYIGGDYYDITEGLEDYYYVFFDSYDDALKVFNTLIGWHDTEESDQLEEVIEQEKIPTIQEKYGRNFGRRVIHGNYTLSKIDGIWVPVRINKADNKFKDFSCSIRGFAQSIADDINEGRLLYV